MKHLVVSYYKKHCQVVFRKLCYCCLWLSFPLFVSYLYANNNHWHDVAKEVDSKIVADSINNQYRLATTVNPIDIGAIVLEGKQTIEVKDDQDRPSSIVGKYERVPNGYSSVQYGSGSWLFDKNGWLYQFDGRHIPYISMSSATMSTSGGYAIKGVFFVGQVIGPKFGVPGPDIGYIKNKKIEIALTKDAPYGSGPLLPFAILKIDFNNPVENQVQGAFQYTVKTCHFGNTYKLSKSPCLNELYYSADALKPFWEGSFSKNNYCYSTYDRVVESGTVTFEYYLTGISYNAGDKIYITVFTLNGSDLGSVAWDYTRFNVASEIYFSTNSLP